jgi:dihydroxy-acid dehydratase
VPARWVRLHVSDNNLAARKILWKPPPPKYERGCGRLYLRHACQAHEGCGFEFLEPGAPTSDPPIILRNGDYGNGVDAG